MPARKEEVSLEEEEKTEKKKEKKTHSKWPVTLHVKLIRHRLPLPEIRLLTKRSPPELEDFRLAKKKEDEGKSRVEGEKLEGVRRMLLSFWVVFTRRELDGSKFESGD